MWQVNGSFKLISYYCAFYCTGKIIGSVMPKKRVTNALRQSSKSLALL